VSGTLAELCDLEAAGGGPGGGPGNGIPGRHPFLEPASDGSLLGKDEPPMDTASADEALLAAGGWDTSASLSFGSSWYTRDSDNVTTCESADTDTGRALVDIGNRLDSAGRGGGGGICNAEGELLLEPRWPIESLMLDMWCMLGDIMPAVLVGVFN
jgi:hypothetical protein